LALRDAALAARAEAAHAHPRPKAARNAFMARFERQVDPSGSH